MDSCCDMEMALDTSNGNPVEAPGLISSRTKRLQHVIAMVEIESELCAGQNKAEYSMQALEKGGWGCFESSIRSEARCRIKEVDPVCTFQKDQFETTVVLQPLSFSNIKTEDDANLDLWFESSQSEDEEEEVGLPSVNTQREINVEADISIKAKAESSFEEESENCDLKQQIVTEIPDVKISLNKTSELTDLSEALGSVADKLCPIVAETNSKSLLRTVRCNIFEGKRHTIIRSKFPCWMLPNNVDKLVPILPPSAPLAVPGAIRNPITRLKWFTPSRRVNTTDALTCLEPIKPPT